MYMVLAFWSPVKFQGVGRFENLPDEATSNSVFVTESPLLRPRVRIPAIDLMCCPLVKNPFLTYQKCPCSGVRVTHTCS